MSKREHAVALAKKGFKVFPCEPNGKKPIWPARVGKETSDPKKVEQIWSEAVTGDPLDYNIGICTDDLFIFDFDTKGGHDAEKAFETIKDTYLRGNETPIAAVVTPSGGLHLYLRMPKGVTASNTAKTVFGDGTDSRSYHGYVLGHGSSIDGKEYSWLTSQVDNLRIPESIDDLPICPNVVIAAAGRPIEKTQTDSSFEYDTPHALLAATDFISRTPPAVQGNGGNDHTYKVAARLRQFGVSPDTALDILSNWNERCEPPWQIEELDRIVQNAFAYATASPTPPGQEFEPYSALAATPYTPPDWPTPDLLEPFDFNTLPEREWLIPGLLARTFLTGLIAPSGAGKTQYLIQMIVALASGQSSLIGSNFTETSKVWLWNQEDDLAELKRRLAASISYFKIDWPQIENNIFMNSGVDKPLMLVARDKSGNLRETKHIAAVIKHMIANNISVLVIDPLVEFHEAEENNNVEMRLVAAALRKIAVQAKAAVIIGHHTKKPDGARSDGFAGNADSGRGASSLQGVTRIMATLYAMTEADAKKLKIKAEDRWRFVRMDGAKSNISASASGAKPDWFERVGHKLRDDGEEIGILAPIELVKSRVMREVDDSKDRLSAEAEAEGLPEYDETEGHPWAAALVNTLIAHGVKERRRVPAAVYRKEAAEAAGESSDRRYRFSAWLSSLKGQDIPAGQGRFLRSWSPAAVGASIRLSWRNVADKEANDELDPSEYQDYQEYSDYLD